MSRKESDFRKRLLVTFQGEADERVRALATGLIELEKTTDASRQAEALEGVFREVHSLKGAARSVNLAEIEAICQAMEDVFATLKRQNATPALPLLDALHQATDRLQGLLTTIQREPVSQDRTRHAPLIRELRELTRNNARNQAATNDLPDMGADEGKNGETEEEQDKETPSRLDTRTDKWADERVVSTSAAAERREESGLHEVEMQESARDDEHETHPAQVTATANPGQPLPPASQTAPNQPRAPGAIAPGTKRPTAAPETVRIATARLESLLLQIEELVSAKLAAGQHAAEARALQTRLAEWEKRWDRIYPLLRTVSQAVTLPAAQAGEASEKQASPHAETNRNGGTNRAFASSQALTQPPSQSMSHSMTQSVATSLNGLLEFLEWNHTWVGQMDTRFTALANATTREQRTLGGMVDHLLQDMKQMLMLPLASIVETLPSLTRDIARQQEKEVQLVMHGIDLEVDRRILQEIKDPLIHLIRNCVDHGIEKPAVREKRGKARRGTISLTIAQQDSSKFEIVVADDGGGLDLAKVKNTAARLGLIAPENTERMSDKETKSLVFHSGLSTSSLITDISGRGLGLAIVQEKIEKLGGVITLESERGVGTTFTLLLPLTLATLRGLLVQSEGHTLILPLTHVERVARLHRSEIQTVQSRETIHLAGQAFSLVRMGQALELPPKSTQPDDDDRLFVVLLSAAEKRIAFVVDAILGDQEVLMKGLGAQLARVRNIAGATVLGSGQVVPILNIPDLVKSAIKSMDGTAHVDAAPATQDKHILIVEDSITARMQLKNILELSGYTVQTAVDGLDALLALRSEHFDLVVSDVDMPRLNGLDLTARIRHDTRLTEMPVILVTTLASREDQARGIEVGANAYITKSNFDQNTLLDAIRRLI